MNPVKQWQMLRSSLSWSYKDLADRLGMSEDFIRRSHEGRQITQVESEIDDAYVRGFAERCVDSVRKINPNLMHMDRDLMTESFIREFKNVQVPLDALPSMEKDVCDLKFTLASGRQVSGSLTIDTWNTQLAVVARKLIHPTPLIAFTSAQSSLRNTEPSAAIPRVKQALPSPPTSMSLQKEECPNCHQDCSGLYAIQCSRCGFQFSQNW